MASGDMYELYNRLNGYKIGGGKYPIYCDTDSIYFDRTSTITIYGLSYDKYDKMRRGLISDYPLDETNIYYRTIDDDVFLIDIKLPIDCDIHKNGDYIRITRGFDNGRHMRSFVLNSNDFDYIEIK